MENPDEAEVFVPNFGHVAGEGGIVEVILVVDIGAVGMRAVYNSACLAQLDWCVFHSLKILAVEAAIGAGRAAGGSLNKDKPIGIIDNRVADPFCGLVKVSILVAGVPGALEGLVLDINCKDVPGVSVSIGQFAPALDYQRLWMAGVVPQAVGGEGIRLEGVKIEQDDDAFGSHIVDDLIHHFKRS